MEEKTFAETEAIQIIAETLCGMLDNNVVRGFGVESFEGWCEDGDIFAGNEYEAECIELMHKVAPLIDELTYKYLNLGY